MNRPIPRETKRLLIDLHGINLHTRNRKANRAKRRANKAKRGW